jgi:hypothetical protein
VIRRGTGAGLAGLVALSGCVADNHPLSSSAESQVDYLLDSNPIFAADVLDAAGRPVLPRQVPFEKRVQLRLITAGAIDSGAYVDVGVEPPNALTLVPIGDGTCEQLPGAFRCTSGDDGIATFLARSDSDWSGEARLTIVGRNEEGRVDVHRAGLPSTAQNFTMVIGDLEGNRVAARFNALSCILSPVPDQTFEKWPAGATRVREAEIRVTPPLTTPGVVEHAPVYVESLDAEVFVTRDPSCAPPRTTRIRLQFDAIGRSPKFYFCFSDIGSSGAELAFTSGELSGLRGPIEVAPEPRLLRVVTTNTALVADGFPVPVADVSVFNADLERIRLRVDIRSSNPQILKPLVPNVTLPGNDGFDEGNVVSVVPLAAGTATIRIAPELHDLPVCETEPLHVSAF